MQIHQSFTKMLSFIESKDKIIKKLENEAYAIVKLDDSARQELSCAKEDLIQEINRPPISIPMDGYSTIEHMPASCLEIQILPCISDVFRCFYGTKDVVFNFDVALHVPFNHTQTYRGIARKEYPLVALIILNKQKNKD